MRDQSPRYLFWAGITFSILMCLIGGCSQRFLAGSDFQEAQDHFSRGSYRAALSKYRQIIEKHPEAEGDRALFEMGRIHSHFRNVQKDYQKALECFQKLIRDYPGSRYREESRLMIALVNKEIAKDRTMVAQQRRIDALNREVQAIRNEDLVMRKKVEGLEQTVFAMKNGPADRVLIEKKNRRLTLLSKDKVLKAYRIALGGEPIGPKEREGDHKTPEGIYYIDARNGNSRYHLSLHISYPNQRDKERAKELGVSPGKDIMIHGLLTGFSEVGERHTALDWTNGCIAVTSEEIEEIDKLVPNGTVVEIRP